MLSLCHTNMLLRLLITNQISRMPVKQKMQESIAFYDAVGSDATAKTMSKSELFCERTIGLMENILLQLG